MPKTVDFPTIADRPSRRSGDVFGDEPACRLGDAPELGFVQNEGVIQGHRLPYCKMAVATQTILQRGQRCPLPRTLAPS